jgi:hypothetical protein
MPRLRASMPRRWRAIFKSIAIIRWSDWAAQRAAAPLALRWPARPDLYGHTPARPGNLIDCLLTVADHRRISASFVLATLLRACLDLAIRAHDRWICRRRCRPASRRAHARRHRPHRPVP